MRAAQAGDVRAFAAQLQLPAGGAARLDALPRLSGGQRARPVTAMSRRDAAAELAALIDDAGK